MNEPFVYPPLCEIFSFQSRQIIMAQAAVNRMSKTLFPRKSSHKRRFSDNESSFDDDDPAWQPSDFNKPRRKRRARDPAENRARNEPLPQSPVHESSHSHVPAAGISVELTKTSNDMWEMFRSIGTEMIICKEGRRMFPALELVIRGLEPDNIYSVFISVQLKDQSRYRYNSSTGWMKIGTGAQPSFPNRMIPHADSRNTGSHFMRKPLSFKTIKMTNDVNTKRNDQLILLSMRSYVPQITIQCHTTGEESVHTLSTCDFIAVTSYQRMEVTQLKIKTNQFAAAFRKRTASLQEDSRENSAESESPQDTVVSPEPIAVNHPTTSNCSEQQSPTISEKECKFTYYAYDVKMEPTGDLDRAPTSHPPTPTSTSTHSSDDEYEEEEYEDDEVDDDECMNIAHPCDDDIPAHIRPFFFELYHYCCLSNTPYHANLCSSRPKPTLPKYTGTTSTASDHHRLLSSVALQHTNTSTAESTSNTEDGSEISLGLLSDFLAL